MLQRRNLPMHAIFLRTDGSSVVELCIPVGEDGPESQAWGRIGEPDVAGLWVGV